MTIWIALKLLTLVLLVIAGVMTYRNCKKAERLFEEMYQARKRARNGRPA